MTDSAARDISLRPLTEDDIPALFEIQLDESAQHLAAFTDTRTARDAEAFGKKYRKILADDAIVNRVIEIHGEVVGSVATFPIEGDTELTYWIRKDWWGRGVATAAVAALLDEVTERPIHARAVEDNSGSVRVLERNAFVRIGSEDSFAPGRQATVTELIFKLA
ncbi:GNAT family N-acetyltransferase [Streptomyces brevispora]|uniref:GNAT family N-acetyltransferase n=1 Tax=Streptomyces brevispora TaxID=887462 RepID=A0A561V6G5_9ACTN|nr:GNAT family N-acetyltransferase [Streptomyces brevispora]TWG07194.1 RimJ/RimL family protein N-acetyltransferase [Streptomyces brevispora]WSC11979.1 GNAT family N-acetyltransferase [Streptomyces brevispora]